jgi:hypothetical protein
VESIVLAIEFIVQKNSCKFVIGLSKLSDSTEPTTLSIYRDIQCIAYGTYCSREARLTKLHNWHYVNSWDITSAQISIHSFKISLHYEFDSPQIIDQIFLSSLQLRGTRSNLEQYTYRGKLLEGKMEF